MINRKKEPRGYPCQNMNILYPSKIEDCVTGYIILEQNAIYPLFSGHNTVCTATAVVELGLVDKEWLFQTISFLWRNLRKQVLKQTEKQDGRTKFKMEAPGGIGKVLNLNGQVLFRCGNQTENVEP